MKNNLSKRSISWVIILIFCTLTSFQAYSKSVYELIENNQPYSQIEEHINHIGTDRANNEINEMNPKFGINAWHKALQLGRADLLSLLREKGADVHKLSSRNFPPLFYAVQGENIESIEYLIEQCQADVTWKDNFGYNFLHLCALKAQNQIARKIESLRKQSFGELIKSVGENGNNPLHVCAEAILIPSLDQLNSEQKNFYGLSLDNQLDLIDFLIEKGVSTSEKNKKGLKPVELATHPEIIEKLQISIEEIAS